MTSTPSSPSLSASTSVSQPTRRGVLSGLAWTGSAVIVAATAPVATASMAPVLAFDKSTYTAAACASLSGAYVTVTSGGTPLAGVIVTVTLSKGYTFTGGSTTTTTTSGSNGRALLPAIVVPSQGNNAVASATATGATTVTAGLASTASSSSVIGLTWANDIISAVPAGLVPTEVGMWGGDQFFAFFLSDTGVLYRSDFGDPWVAVSPSGVVDFEVAQGVAGNTYAIAGVIYTTGSTVALSWGPTLLPALPPGVTASAVAFGSDASVSQAYFLGSDTYLYRSTGNASSTSGFGAWTRTSPAGVTSFRIDHDGSVAIYRTASAVGVSSNNSALPALPNGVTPLAVGFSSVNSSNTAYFLGSDGFVYRSSGFGAWTKVSAAGMTSLEVGRGSNGAVFTSGSAIGSVGTTVAPPVLPSGVTASSIGYAVEGGEGDCYYFVGSDGYVYRSAGGGAWTRTSPTGATLLGLGQSGAVYALRSTC